MLIACVLSLSYKTDMYDRGESFVWVHVDLGGTVRNLTVPESAVRSLAAGDEMEVVVVPCRRFRTCGVQLPRLP